MDYFSNFMTTKENSDLFRKAKFKSRRGLNELDQIFVPFVLKEFQGLNVKNQMALIEILEWEDIDLADEILYRKGYCDEDLKDIFSKIIQFSSEI